MRLRVVMIRHTPISGVKRNACKRTCRQTWKVGSDEYEISIEMGSIEKINIKDNLKKYQQLWK